MKPREELAKPTIHSHSTPTEHPDAANESNSDDNYLTDVFKTTPQDQEILHNLSLVLENSPVEFQITKTAEELQPSTFTVPKKKSNEIQKLSVNKLLGHVVPGQGNSLKNLLFPDKNTIDVPPEIEKHLF